MGDLQATVEFLIELYKFYNVDLFIRGYFQFRLTFKPPKSSHSFQVEVCDGHGETGAFTLFPAFVTNDGQTAVSRTFNIYYKDEEVLLKDVFLFRVHLLIDSTKAADCIDKTALEMTVDVHFTDQVVRENNYRLLPLVTSRTLKFHFSCFRGLHHQIPLLFDYYYFSVLDLIIHANVVSLGLPNWRILKQIKTSWFSKSNPSQRSSTPLFYMTLFGNRSQIGSQFYSDNALRYAAANSSCVSRESFEKASAIHRNLCAILAMAHSQLLTYFSDIMHHFDEKQKIRLVERINPADLVEGLCKKLETLQSCEEVFDEMCGDMSVLNNELALLWSQFQESIMLNDQVRPVLREQHHHERMIHFSEAFFVHELPWNSLLNATDSSFQKHLSMGQCVKSSKYLSMIPPVAVECAEVDGDSSSTPIFFEDRYINTTGIHSENVHAVAVSGCTEADILEHKPLSFGILNRAFKDHSPLVTDSGDSSEFDVDASGVWVDIKSAEENDIIAARMNHAEEKTTAIEGVNHEGQDGTNDVVTGHQGTSLDKKDVSMEDKEILGIGDQGTTNDKNVLCEYDAATTGNTDIQLNLKPDSEEHSALKKENNAEILANRKENVEAPLERNDDECDDQDEREHCEVRQDNVAEVVGVVIDSDTEDRDLCDNIAAIDSEKQAKELNSESLSETDPLISSIASSDNKQNTNDNILGEEIEDICATSTGENCSRNSVGQNEAIDISDKISQEPKIFPCLVSDADLRTSVVNLNAVDYDCSFEEKENLFTKELVSSDSVLPQSISEKVSVKNLSSVKSVGCSDITSECLSEEISSENKVESRDTAKEYKLQSNSETGSSTLQSVTLLQVSSKAEHCDEVGDICVKEERTNMICWNSDATTSLIDTKKSFKNEPTNKQPEFTDLSNITGSEEHLETTSQNNTSNSSLNHIFERNLHQESKMCNATQVTLTTRVSNSVFYGKTSEKICSVSILQNSSKGGSQSKPISDTTLDAVRLANASADAIGCFCGGKTKKMSSPYRPKSETEASNVLLQKAKQEVISKMNYCGMLYSDFTTKFVVQPYFIKAKPDLSLEPVHFVVCVHGLEGNSGDLRLLRCFLEMVLPSTKFEFLMSEVNQDNTFLTFETLTEKLVSEILHHMEAFRISPSRISFIGHSLGNIIIRSALNHPLMEPYVELFHTFLSLSGPHLGMVHHTSSLVSTGMWLLQKWKKSDSLLQLCLNDSTDMRDTFIYKLSKKKGLEYFTNVLLVSSVQDHYVPFHSSRIELPKSLRSNSQECIIYREMMENILTPLLNQPNRTLVRYSVYHCLPSSTNSFIGRAAHIAMLDSELFIEKLICTSAAKYFQ